MPPSERNASGRSCFSLADFILVTLFLGCRYKRTAGGLWETTRIAAHAICESRLRTHALRKNRRYLPIFVARHASKQDRERGSSLCFQLACFCCYVLAVFLFVFVIASVIVISSHYLLRKDLLKVFQTQGLKPCLWIGHFFLASVPKLTAMAE